MSTQKILIVEDDAAILLGLEGALSDEGYEVHSATTGPDGLQKAVQEKPDLIILDVMLPGMSGYEICKRLRDQQIAAPVIMLTARVEENDKVLGLELGADDYVTKPFSLRELLARVRANLRRRALPQNGEKAAGENADQKFVFGETVVDLKRREVYKRGQRQDVTNREFKLLEYFIHHPGEVLTRDRLLDEIWGYNVYPTTRTVDNHILRLRKHVEPNPESPIYIKTVRGAGYLFDLNNDSEHE